MKKLIALFSIMFLIQASTVLAQDYCEGNFDGDSDQDGSDAFTFKTDFGRHQYNDPCPPESVWKIFQDGTDESVEWVDADNARFAIYDVYGNNGTGDPDRYDEDIVLDKDTGLIWARNANLAGETKTWQDAIDFCRQLNLGKRMGWRLPTQEELSSLVDPLRQNPPSLPIGNPFTGVDVSDRYWTSTTREWDSNFARYVEFWNGFSHSRLKTNSHWVWPVFGGTGYATGNW